jgi:hypothetical protein
VRAALPVELLAAVVAREAVRVGLRGRLLGGIPDGVETGIGGFTRGGDVLRSGAVAGLTVEALGQPVGVVLRPAMRALGVRLKFPLVAWLARGRAHSLSGRLGAGLPGKQQADDRAREDR